MQIRNKQSLFYTGLQVDIMKQVEKISFSIFMDQNGISTVTIRR